MQLATLHFRSSWWQRPCVPWGRDDMFILRGGKRRQERFGHVAQRQKQKVPFYLSTVMGLRISVLSCSPGICWKGNFHLGKKYSYVLINYQCQVVLRPFES